MQQNPPISHQLDPGIYEHQVSDSELSGVLSIRRAESEPQLPQETLGQKLGRILLALIFPGPYAVYHGVSGPWNMTSFTYLWHFMAGDPLDREAIQPALFVWAVLNFLIWLLIYIISKAGFIAFLFAYFLLNLIFLLGAFVKAKVFDSPSFGGGLGFPGQRRDYQEF